MKYLIFAFYLFLAFGISLQAQDPRFSQFNQNPLHLNPALTGFYDGGLRLSLNYNSQLYSVLSSEEYVSYSGSLENKFRVGNNFVGLGAFILQDQIGISGYERTYYNLSGAYHQRLSQGRGSYTPDMFLILGGQVGFGQYAFSPSDLWFSSQYDNNLLEVNRATDSGEAFAQGGANSFLDINVGLMYYLAYQDGGGFYIGGAMHHLNNPDVGLLEETQEKLFRRFTVNTGGEIVMGKDLSFLPSAVWQSQGPTMSTMGGGSFRIGIKEDNLINLRAGAWAHLAQGINSSMQLESIIVSTTFQISGWQIGFSYDITTSGLSQSNFSRGAFGISLVKITDANYPVRVKCPVL